jgi:DNA (cytosine-5)-methyltransferase 1
MQNPPIVDTAPSLPPVAATAGGIYYNENDPKAAAWLRELIRQGHLPAGRVDERSITEVKVDELTAYIQCHFFAGIGGWPYALTLAGWPVSRPVWTGSCPCQPFSAAGKGLGTADSRHLWPVFAQLIRACQPPTIFGEQVASRAGREWLGGVFADLAGMGYSRAGADLCAAGVGAPHIRQRLFWVAVASGKRSATGISRPEPGQEGDATIPDDAGNPAITPPHLQHLRLGHAEFQRLEGHSRDEHHGNQPGWNDTVPARSIAETSGAGHWRVFDLLRCTDGKARRVEPGTFPLAHGVPGRVGLLRGYGNAIVPQVAQAFIEAFLTSHE